MRELDLNRLNEEFGIDEKNRSLHSGCRKSLILG